MTTALGWGGIIRLGLVQTALGAIVLLVTSTMNRVMVVELALPASIPGTLVALHYGVQILRPRLGHGSDRSGRRTTWIIGGVAMLGAGGILASLGTAAMAWSTALGVAITVPGFIIVGLGVGTAGTALLVFLSARVAPERRAAAAAVVWLMMLAGFVATAAIAGQLLDPFSLTRLVAVTVGASIIALLVTVAAVWGLERESAPIAPRHGDFRTALGAVWAEPQARHFTLFVFLSMFAYSAQELILEPFGGVVFGMTPGQSARLAGTLHGGVFTGMILVAIAGSVFRRGRLDALREWAIAGCAGAALASLGLMLANAIGPAWPVRATVFALGLTNGCFVIAALGTMMGLAAAARDGHEGVRMGVWGAAQAMAFCLGSLSASIISDLARAMLGSPVAAYAAVFAVQAALFVVAGWQGALVFPGMRRQGMRLWGMRQLEIRRPGRRRLFRPR